ncbi:hypothetical protein HGA88_00540 [Candidatus Roizmanbacteria bacterium]|nr:hypothetical protein [Candidatus Roizmanbacteria bacterium]
MTIYVAHAAAFDYENELYEPIRSSELSNKYTFVLPYEQRETPINSKEVLENAQLVIAEISYPSTGMGIELGWANLYKKPIICIHKRGTKLSRSLKIISDKFVEYEDSSDMISKITHIIMEREKSNAV